MADGYSVGNLSIAFNALDKTSDDFKALAKNLRSVVNLINKVSTADLGKFRANVKQITTAFNPFLNKLTKASTGLEAFNAVAKQIGVRNISNVAQVYDEMEHRASETAESIKRISTESSKGEAKTVVDHKEITRASDAIEEQTLKVMRLTKEVANLKSAWLKNGTTENSVAYLTKKDELEAARKELQELTEAQTRAGMSDAELQVRDNALAVEKFRLKTATKRTRLEFLRLQLATGKAGEQTNEYKREIRQLVKELDEADKIAGKLSKGSFSKFIGKVSRIAFYRMIRRGLQLITQTFTGTIQAYAKVDDGINSTMSSITTSMTTIKYGLGSMIFPILQAIEPVLKQISLGFANMANVINASLSTTGYYTKINTDKLIEYNKAANLLDFDKFRSLSNDDTSIFETAKVENLNDELGASATNYKLIYDIIKNIGSILNNVFNIVGQIVKTASPILTVVLAVADGILYIVRGITWLASESGLLAPILGGILGYLTLIGATKIITILSSGSLIKYLTAVISLLKEDFRGTLKMVSGDLAKVMSTTKMLAISFGALTASISYLIQNWKDMSTLGKTVTLVISGIIAAAVGLFTAIVAAKWAGLGVGAAIKAGLSAAALTAAIGIAIGTAISTAKSNVQAYANGGIPDKGTMFVAGEAGAEMVYNMPSGQSGVANIRQIHEAVYTADIRALNEWWAQAKYDIPQFQSASSTGIYEVVKGEMRRRGEKPARV